MRYAPESNLLFLHIPKAAGSSVKITITPWSRTIEPELVADLGEGNVDLTVGRFKGYVEHPDIGRIHHAHMPMPYVAEYFPATFKLVQGADCFAIMRHPRKRFVSSVSQYLREFKGIGASRLTPRMVMESAQEVAAEIADKAFLVEPRHMHFGRQRSFVENPANPIKVTMFTTEQLPQVESFLRSRTGREDVVIGRQNATVVPKSGFRAVHGALANVGTLLPKKWRYHGRKAMMRLPFYQTSFNIREVTFDPEVEAFIDEYYAADRELYEQVLAEPGHVIG